MSVLYAIVRRLPSNAHTHALKNTPPHTHSSGILGTAFAFGIALVVTAWAFFRISGSHFNPAITLSSLITGHINVPRAVLYFVAQLLGAMLGVALTRGTTPSGDGIGQVNALVRLSTSLFGLSKAHVNYNSLN